MTLVTVDEARNRLPELIGRMAAGEQVVITESGKWVAALADPAADAADPGGDRRPPGSGQRGGPPDGPGLADRGGASAFAGEQ